VGKVNFLKITLATILLCTLMFFDVLLYWFIGFFFFDPSMLEVVSHSVSKIHVVEASLVIYAIVFPVTVIIVSRKFKIGKIGLKCLLASAIMFTLAKPVLNGDSIIAGFSNFLYTTSLIILIAVCYLLLRFYAPTLPDGA
jgi:hypothetical protein